MEYRKLGRTGLTVGTLGLGTEHLERTRETIDQIVDMAVEAGVNYVDAIYTNPSGQDAAFWEYFGAALRRHRDDLVIAAHWGPADSYGPDESRQYFEQILAQLGNDYAEVAFLTVVDSEWAWTEWSQRSLEHLHRYKEQGRIGHIGLSGHNIPIALQAVDSGLIDVLMFHVNLVRHDDAEIRALLRTCAERDVGVVAMKPYHGGTLFLREGGPSGITPAQCLAYVLDQSVATTVPGPRNTAEMRATLHYLEATAAEKDYSHLLGNLYTYLAGQCVYCDHCLPCPQEISIGWILWMLDYSRHGDLAGLKKWYDSMSAKASDCIECGDCLARCPFDVDIMARLQQAVETFETS